MDKLLQTAFLLTDTSLSTYLTAISGTFNSLFKVLFIFPSQYLFAIGISQIFSFRWNLPPTLRSNPKERDSMKQFRTIKSARYRRDSHPLWNSFPKELTLPLTWNWNLKLQVRLTSDFQIELFSVHSPLLRESWLVSFPPLNYMLKFSG